MQTEFTAEQTQYRDVVARFLREHATTTATRKLMAEDAGYDPAVWRQLCGELGAASIHIPEQHGGAGFGMVELGIVAEEMGRHLYCGPFFASAVMAGSALLEAAEESQKARLLPDLAAGERIMSLALGSVSAPGATPTLNAEGGRLNGTAPVVIDAHNANSIVVIATDAEGLGLYLVDTGAGGVDVALRQTIDQTRKVCSVSFDGAAAEPIGRVTSDALEAIWDRISVALAHEMMGGAQQLFDSTLEYVKLRYQFGRPIGSFQSMKHRAADLLMEIEWARAVTHQAAFEFGLEAHLPSMAKAMASDVYMEAGRAAIQLRGGIGFTWEEDTHLWFKRAKSSEVLMGAPAMHRERMLTRMEEAA